MPLRRWLVLIAVCCVSGLVVACSTSASPDRSATGNAPAPAAAGSAATADPQAQASGQTRALLIGVTEFIDKEMKAHNLEGPGNDVALFKSVLEREPFKVPAANITMLAGLPADKSQQPTKENIRNAFSALAKPGASQVVILMAGHGSQQPANNDPTDNETDGFDEIFLPADAAGWDMKAGVVRNAIVDDEINQWLAAIRKTGASVWILFDSCQSGTMTRGAPGTVERERRIEPSKLIPADVLATVKGKSGTRGGSVEDDILGIETMGDVAALFAAHMTETTPERQWTENGPVHGLFTYTLAEVLARSTTPMTYRELGQLVMDRYRSMPRYAPNPMMEGGGLDRNVLGQRTWPDRPLIRLIEKNNNDEWTVDAGSIQGVTKGSILELFPPAGAPDADKPIGHLVVRSDKPTSARVAPTEFAKMPAPAATRVVVGSRARVRSYEPGALRLKVAVQQQASNREFAIAPGGSVPPRLAAALKQLPSTSGGLAEHISTDTADWYLRVLNGAVVLVPAAGWQLSSLPADARATSQPQQFKVGNIDDATLAESLGEKLRRIGRAQALVRMASVPTTAANLDVTVRRYDGEKALPGQFPTTKDFSVRIGTGVDFQIRNVGNKTLNVTLLYVDATYAIQAVWPGRTAPVGENQLKPQAAHVTPKFALTEPVGWESLIAIGVDANGNPPDLRMLAQPGLELAQQEAKSRGGGTQESPLQRLLTDAVFGRTRGPLEELGDFVVKVVSWRTDPAKTP